MKLSFANGTHCSARTRQNQTYIFSCALWLRTDMVGTIHMVSTVDWGEGSRGKDIFYNPLPSFLPPYWRLLTFSVQYKAIEKFRGFSDTFQKIFSLSSIIKDRNTP